MKRFGLIGKKLGHSFSKKYFTKKFDQSRIDASYELYELEDIDEFPALLRNQPGLIGLNVTIPYKSQVIPFLDQLSAEAVDVHAVNTIRISPRGYLEGFNTDIPGFRLALTQLLEGEEVKKALILGTGGASASVAYVFKQLNISFLFASRNPRTTSHISYEELFKLPLEKYRIIVNTTPVGMYPRIDEELIFPYTSLSRHHYVMDLIYNPSETLFLSKSKEHGAKVLNGMPMLIEQAERAWDIWTRL